VTLEATTGFQASIETLTSGTDVFYDRDYTFDSFGSFTGTHRYVKMSNNDKHIRHSHIQMKLRLPQPTTVYAVKLDDYDLPWLHTDGWALTSLTGVSYHGIHETRHTDWGVANDLFELEETHYAANGVWQKTFPAGTVEMRGNNGGDGSYLMFLSNPAHQPSTAITLWDQHMPDAGRVKCNNNVDMQYVADQATCQLLAVQNGHAFYSFRHNGESSGHKCMSSATCDSPLTNRNNDWAIYAMHYVMADGCLTSGASHERAVVSAASGETASVRCCSMAGDDCDTQDLPGGCQTDKTYEEAVAICAEHGGRLCSEAEINTGVCCGSGCGYDGHQVWVSH